MTKKLKPKWTKGRLANYLGINRTTLWQWTVFEEFPLDETLDEQLGWMEDRKPDCWRRWYDRIVSEEQERIATQAADEAAETSEATQTTHQKEAQRTEG